MKFSLIALPALSAIALAAPAPTLFNKDCIHKKPYKHYSDDWKGCIAYNADEMAYSVKCLGYKPEIKICKPDDKKDDEYEKKKKEVGVSISNADLAPLRVCN